MLVQKIFKSILFLFSVLIFSNCSVSKTESPGKQNSEEFAYDSWNNFDCIESLKNLKSGQRTGKVKVVYEVDSIITNDTAISLNKTFSINLDKESELLILNDQYAVKIFKVESQEYGQLYHLTKEHLFVFKDGCWKRKVVMNYQKLAFDSSVGFGSFSTGFPDTNGYIKIVRKLYGNL